MASSFREVCRFAVHTRTGRAAFLDFSTLRPVFKKVRFQDPCGRSAKTMQYMCVFTKEHCRLDVALDTLTKQFKSDQRQRDTLY